MNTKQIGNLTELQVITGLYAFGCDISIPFGNSQKYDLIMDYNNHLYRIQVKHAREILEEGKLVAFSFNTRWQGHNASGYTQNYYTKEEIDFFATYNSGRVFLIPVEQCSGKKKKIRLVPTKNNQTKGVNFAEDYLAEEVLKTL